MPNKKKTYILPNKTEVSIFFLQMLLILIMNKNVPLHPNSSYYQMYISIIQKSDIIIINIMRQPKPVSWFEISLRADIFLYFCFKEN